MPGLPSPAIWRMVQQTLRVWSRRHTGRRDLRGLAPHLLEDVGLTAEDRDDECRKWFWEGVPPGRAVHVSVDRKAVRYRSS